MHKTSFINDFFLIKNYQTFAFIWPKIKENHKVMYSFVINSKVDDSILLPHSYLFLLLICT